ncbi:Uncharacterized protein BP5553_10571 [Venustampulla echinocandica]|uniref:Dienelactone hydrolase domain-containing protein n=1 Tax=Venustampulla echinocandica TaxID=2656787 RepID=A0A370T8W8_9HELO|nr:Uncharacterized protein BP5553_10571 [Venustampulla echinocandica]RDL29944.1 Uncharacterized protein BP5553_10571 [Venustampulla echinocandica]
MSGITCPDCLTGSVKREIPTGTVTAIHGLPAYIARPEGPPKGLIVIIPDAFGWELPNNRLLADIYAKEGGFLVYLPDFMNGHIPSAAAMHAMESLLTPSPSIFTTIFYKPVWLVKVFVAIVPFLLTNKESAIKPKIFKFHEALRNDPETSKLKLGSAGFCWGGKYTILLSQTEDLVDAGFTAHPSKMKFPNDWDKVQKPLAIAIGDVDLGINLKMVKDIKKLLEDMKPKEQNQVVIYPRARHGFAVRANPEEEDQVKSAVEAKDQALAWFWRWLARGEE